MFSLLISRKGVIRTEKLFSKCSVQYAEDFINLIQKKKMNKSNDNKRGRADVWQDWY